MLLRKVHSDRRPASTTAAAQSNKNRTGVKSMFFPWIVMFRKPSLVLARIEGG